MNTEEIQLRLWKESQDQRLCRLSEQPGRHAQSQRMRASNLVDLVHSPVWLEKAAEKVLGNSKNKAVGIDKVTVAEFNKNRDKNLAELRSKLKRGNYRPQPVKRAEKLKANGEKRPLGISCLIDKIVQEAIRMILEPIFEPEFHERSYGFRPHRSTYQATQRCARLIQRGYDRIIEGDVKACFDKIAHTAILKAIGEKVKDRKLIELIGHFLKAGVSIRGNVEDTTEGVPQGGIISPLLANIALNKLDWFLHEKGRGEQKMEIEFVRYADDWCVFLRNGTREYAEAFKEEIATFLRKTTKLELSQEKTLVTEADNGIDFLGLHIVRNSDGEVRTKITDKKLDELKAKVDNACKKVGLRTATERMNRMLNGWHSHYCQADNYGEVARKLDEYALEQVGRIPRNRRDCHTSNRRDGKGRRDRGKTGSCYRDEKDTRDGRTDSRPARRNRPASERRQDKRRRRDAEKDRGMVLDSVANLNQEFELRLLSGRKPIVKKETPKPYRPGK